MFDDLRGKTALITGGARGQGASHARLLAASGVKVVLTDLRDELGEQVAKDIQNTGGDALYLHGDVSSTQDWQDVIDGALGRYGALNILVNNAGIVQHEPVDACSDEAWDAVVATNLTGVFKGMRAVIPAMRAAGGGAIVNISSAFGVTGTYGYAGYVATKFGVCGITKSAALTYASENIRVNAIAPGNVDSPMLDEEKILMADNPYFDFEEWLSKQPIARLAQPEEISNLVKYLVSDASSYCTGAVWSLDGGMTSS